MKQAKSNKNKIFVFLGFIQSAKKEEEKEAKKISTMSDQV